MGGSEVKMDPWYRIAWDVCTGHLVLMGMGIRMVLSIFGIKILVKYYKSCVDIRVLYMKQHGMQSKDC